MGLILQGVESIKEKYNHCLDVSDRINTYKLRRSIGYDVLDCFRAIRPLSREPKIVVRVDDEEFQLWEWIRHKRPWNKIGRVIVDGVEFMDIIRMFGERMKPLVRSEIASEFSSLVDLTFKLLPYNALNSRITIPPTKIRAYRTSPRIEFVEIDVEMLGVHTDEPQNVLLFDERGGRLIQDLTDINTPTVLEDLIDHVVRLYDSVDMQISTMKEHNDKIIEEMRKVVAPFLVANEIHR